MKRVRVPAPYLPVFCRELYQLVRSGIPLGEGLAMLREDETDPDARSWLDALCRFIEEGMPLAAALRETEAFPAYMTDMVALAEDTGRLEDVLLSLQRHYDRQLRMAWMLQGVRQAARVSDEEGLRMAEQAVRQAAVSCYALEGAYPASYADLKQRSGVAVDEERYIIFYEIFASNIMPDVTVLERQVAP